MGKGSEGIAAGSCDCENDGLGCCEARHVSISPQENRGGTAGEVGKGEGPAKEGCLEERNKRDGSDKGAA